MDSVQEGFYNAPAMYGSNVRKVGKINDWQSGFTEAGKVCEVLNGRRPDLKAVASANEELFLRIL